MQDAQRDRTGRATGWVRVSLALGLLVLSIGVAVDTLVWFRLQHALDQRFVALSRRAAASGWTVDARAGARGGWPLVATMSVTRPRFEGGRALVSGGIGWSGDGMVLSLSPLHPHVLSVVLKGTQSLHLGNRRLMVWGATSTLEVDGDRVSVQGDAMHLALAGAGPDDIVRAASLSGELHWRPETAGGTDLALTLRDVALPLPYGDEGGRVVQRVRLDLSLDGRLPAGDRARTETAGSWKRDGGALRIAEASLDWDGAGAALSGRAVPRDDGTLDGDFTLDLTQPDRMLAALRQSGAIGAGRAVAIGAVVGLVAAGEHPQDSTAQTHLPLTLRGDVLALGAIPLLTLPSP